MFSNIIFYKCVSTVLILEYFSTDNAKHGPSSWVDEVMIKKEKQTKVVVKMKVIFKQ